MPDFIHDNFILQSSLAQKLYHDYAKDLPIIDYHSHLEACYIRDNHHFQNLTEIWLAGDHYKWRAMRTLGIEEYYITGGATDYEKFEKWAEAVPSTLRNPLYHWTHMELKNPFGITELLQKDTAKTIYDKASALLLRPDFAAQSLLTRFNVEMIGTTDDPIDQLLEHKAIQAQSAFKTKVKPTFRPDKVLALGDVHNFRTYILRLGERNNFTIKNLDTLFEALRNRILYFDTLGCVSSDHGLRFLPALPQYSRAETDRVFQDVLSGVDAEAAAYEQSFTFYVLSELSRIYHEMGWVQQFHLGPLRNTNKKKLQLLGLDTGYDSIGDYPQAENMANYFDYLEKSDQLTKTIIYNVNPTDNAVFASMVGNFQEAGVRGKIQFGSGWWFMDQLDGMTNQLNQLSNLGLISCFIGMLTDSRSFLSYSRHDYFRRLLCNLFADDVLKGYIPHDEKWIGAIIKDICYANAHHYFKA